MRISDWSSDVCSSDLPLGAALVAALVDAVLVVGPHAGLVDDVVAGGDHALAPLAVLDASDLLVERLVPPDPLADGGIRVVEAVVDALAHPLVPEGGPKVAAVDGAGVGQRLLPPVGAARSEERRGGNEGGRTCRSRWLPYHS